MKICFLSNGTLPIPATSGGAVENLVQMIIDKNEEVQNLELSVISIFDEKTLAASKKLNNTKVIFIKISNFVNFFDSVIYSIAKLFLKNKSYSFRKILGRINFINQSKKELLKNNFDYVVAENSPTLFWVMKNKKVAEKYNGKFFYHAHNEPSGNFFSKKQIKNCAKIICVSDFIKKSWQQKYELKDNQLCVLRNAVPSKYFTKTLLEEEKIELRKKYNLKNDDFVILFTGRLNKQKGIYELFDAIKNCHDENVKLLVVGSSFFGGEKKSKVESESIFQNVIFTGYVNYEEIWKLYKIADIGCFPSIWNEPALLTGIESLQSGLPMVTTLSGGIPEYAKPDCGILLPRDENLSKNILDSILKLKANPLLRKSMSECCLLEGKLLNENVYYNDFCLIFQ